MHQDENVWPECCSAGADTGSAGDAGGNTCSQLVAAQLRSWAARQEESSRELRQQQEDAGKSLQRRLAAILADHEATVERMLEQFLEDKLPASLGSKGSNNSPRSAHGVTLLPSTPVEAFLGPGGSVGPPSPPSPQNRRMSSINRSNAVDTLSQPKMTMTQRAKARQSLPNVDMSRAWKINDGGSIACQAGNPGDLTFVDVEAPAKIMPALYDMTPDDRHALERAKKAGDEADMATSMSRASRKKRGSRPHHTNRNSVPKEERQSVAEEIISHKQSLQSDQAVSKRLSSESEVSPKTRVSRPSAGMVILPWKNDAPCGEATDQKRVSAGNVRCDTVDSLKSANSSGSKKAQSNTTLDMSSEGMRSESGEQGDGVTETFSKKVIHFDATKAESASNASSSYASGTSSEQSSGVSESEMPDGGRRRSGARRFSKWEAMQREKNMQRSKSSPDEMRASVSRSGTRVHRWVSDSRNFDYVTMAALISQAVFIGLEVEYKAQNQTRHTPMFFLVLSVFYCFVFIAEISFRIVSSGPRRFFQHGVNWQWHWFDTSVVVLQVIETCIMVASQGDLDESSLISKLARLSPATRVVRLVRSMRFFRSSRVLVTMIVGTMKSGLNATALLVLVMYVFAIVFTQSTVDYLVDRDAPDDTHLNLRTFWGTLPRAIFTLTKSIFGGLDWQDAALPLSDVGWANVGFFLFYIVAVHLAVMNVVNSLFLQRAMEQAQTDQEHVIQMRLREKSVFVKRLHHLFNSLDDSHDGTISLQEFESHLKDEHFQALLQTFEIDNADAWTFFKLLDTDGGGLVDINEFVDGCIRLKGGAKSIQMAQLMYHHKWIMDKLAGLSDVVHTELKPLKLQHEIVVKQLDVTHDVLMNISTLVQSSSSAADKDAANLLTVSSKRLSHLVRSSTTPVKRSSSRPPPRVGSPEKSS